MATRYPAAGSILETLRPASRVDADILELYGYVKMRVDVKRSVERFDAAYRARFGRRPLLVESEYARDAFFYMED